MSLYRNPALQRLTEEQISLASRDDRLKQIERAEFLLNELQPSTKYRYTELCEKITTRKGCEAVGLELTGAEAMHDLRCFVEDLSDSADIPADDAGDEVWTIEDVSRRYQVSSKTVSRWRDKGLVSRRFRFGGRKRVGFLKSSVERFVAKHPDEIARGSRFTQISVDEREAMIERARTMARDGGRPIAISLRLARDFGRSLTTVRYTLKDFDRNNPNCAVYQNSGESLTDERRLELYRRSEQGVDVQTLAQDFNRSRTMIYKILAQVRAEQLLYQPIEYVDSPDFHREHPERLILAEPPVSVAEAGVRRAPAGLPPYLESLYSMPLLTKEQEVFYFRKMNYLKFKAAERSQQLDPCQPKTRDMNEIERLKRQADEVKNLLIKSNLRLVVSIARKRMKHVHNFFEMVSDGNMSLIRAIDKFDYSRGFKFSTYASWAIIKNYARSIPAEITRLERFRTGTDEVLDRVSDADRAGSTSEFINHRQHDSLSRMIAQLPDREREIIVARYGLGESSTSQTLEQIGAVMGVTKERVRQIESRALVKLRAIVRAEHLEIPGF